jgi:hypothetical protein
MTDLNQGEKAQGFSNALFINITNPESNHVSENEIQDGVDNMNISDSFRREKKSSDNKLSDFNFKDCLTSDLLKKLEESSPIRCNRTHKNEKKSHDFNLMANLEDESEDFSNNKTITRDITYSLFYSNKNRPPFNSEKFQPDGFGGDFAKFNTSFNNGSVENESNRIKEWNTFKNSGQAESNRLTVDNSKYFNAAEDVFTPESQTPKISPLSDDISFFPKSYRLKDRHNNQTHQMRPGPGLRINENFSYSKPDKNINSFYNYYSELESPKQMCSSIGRNMLDNYQNFNEKHASYSNSPEDLTKRNPNNRSFMYGKSGWICLSCKNFNYDSKLFI